MSLQIRRVEYFNSLVTDAPADAFGLLTVLADLGINLLAFTGVPEGPSHVQLRLFPEDPALLIAAAEKSGLALEGPHPALIVQGDDQLGAFAKIHERLGAADVAVFAATGVTDGRGSFGYVLYVTPEKIDRAVEVLDMVTAE